MELQKVFFFRLYFRTYVFYKLVFDKNGRYTWNDEFLLIFHKTFSENKYLVSYKCLASGKKWNANCLFLMKCSVAKCFFRKLRKKCEARHRSSNTFSWYLKMRKASFEFYWTERINNKYEKFNLKINENHPKE